MAPRLPIRSSLPPLRVPSRHSYAPPAPANSHRDNLLDGLSNLSLGTNTEVQETSDSRAVKEFRRSFPNQQWSENLLQDLEQLGRSSGTHSHKVQDRHSGAIYLRKSIYMRDRYTAPLLKQITLISSVNHPNIVNFHGAYLSAHSREVHVITEFCGGGSLKTVGANISRLGLVIPGDKAMSHIINGIFQGLNHLDSMGLLHGGIRPGNILLTQDGAVKLCDFSLGEDVVYGEMSQCNVAYAAPERIRGEKYDVRSDVWSAGITILEFAQNRYPYPEVGSEIERMLQITGGDPPQLRDQDGVEYAAGMKDLLSKSLNPSAGARAKPSELIKHPWLVQTLQRSIDMRKWIRQATSVGVKPNRRFTVAMPPAPSTTTSRPRSMSVRFKHREGGGTTSYSYSNSTYAPSPGGEHPY
ncbi:kinase-like domain-containing protein [Pterulicium gracile]|uniref:mitogen-activated protein kinase kinase n=1 Tax=Pterulicium gracile TaxID=1884261 RepID=A0A5C3QR77_9AGAR|nr:kinase-like domain-containing protein [Pterula gracilis]